MPNILYGVPISQLNLPTALRNTLYRHDIYMAERLDNMTDNELMSMPRISVKSVKLIRATLEDTKQQIEHHGR